MKEGETDAGFIYHEGKLLGLNLGWQYAAEHECGIRRIREDFGVDFNGVGVEGRVIHKVPENFGSWSGVLRRRGSKDTVNCKGFGPKERLDWYFGEMQLSPEGLFTAWSDRSFAAVSTNIEAVEEILKAFENLDICFSMGRGSGPLANAGLVIAIGSALPAEILDNWAQESLEARALKHDATKTGIEDRLRKAKKQFWALEPRRRGAQVIFWLNPMDQHLYQAGWYTVEDLDKWIAGTGPVLKGKS